MTLLPPITETQLVISSCECPPLSSSVFQSLRFWAQALKGYLSNVENIIGTRLKVIIKGLLIPP